MHRPALARGTTCSLAIKFRQHGLQIAVLGQIMRVAAMGRSDHVLPIEMRTHADRDRLLADAEMSRAAHFLLGVERRDAFLDAADTQ